MEFQQLGLSRPILNALQELGYTKPTPIQRAAIPAVLQGRDVLGLAQTGTGKTCAFAAPILQILARDRKKTGRKIRALIVTPTRELAIQIGESFDQYGCRLPLKNTVIFGGVGQEPQVQRLRGGVDILTATPGRLLDLQAQGHVDLSALEIFVLDEADRMLDMGFIHDVRRIIKLLPDKRQTLFFSATMPEEVAELVDILLHEPVRAAVDPVSSPVEAIAQSVYYVDKTNKPKLLFDLIGTLNVKNAIVFTRTKHGANKVADFLVKKGVSAAAIHGNKSQTARQAALGGFKNGSVQILVATDIAARGLDISGLSHAFNYDLPEVPETYVHRIGRTGRAGQEGTAVAFCCIDEVEYLRGIEKLIDRKLLVVDEHNWPMQILEPTPKDKNGKPVRAGAKKTAKKESQAPKELPAQSEKTIQQTPSAKQQPSAVSGKSKKKKTNASRPIVKENEPANRMQRKPIPTSDTFAFSQFQVAGQSAPQEIVTLAENRPIAQPRSGGKPQKFNPSVRNEQQAAQKKTPAKKQVQKEKRVPESVPKHVYSRREENPASGETLMDATARFLMPRTYAHPAEQPANSAQKQKKSQSYRGGKHTKKRQG